MPRHAAQGTEPLERRVKRADALRHAAAAAVLGGGGAAAALVTTVAERVCTFGVPSQDTSTLRGNTGDWLRSCFPCLTEPTVPPALRQQLTLSLIHI